MTATTGGTGGTGGSVDRLDDGERRFPKGVRPFRAPDGHTWGVEVRSPGSSNAMIVFHHPDPTTGRRNRYAWWLTHGPESRDVTARLEPKRVLDALGEEELRRLFRRSMAIDRIGKG